MLLQGLPADGGHIIQRGGKADLAAHIAGAGLKFAWSLGVGGALLVYGGNHIAAA